MVVINKFQSERTKNCPVTSVWTEFSELAVKYENINLGQGFPSFQPPRFVTDSLIEVVNQHDDVKRLQYTRTKGDGKFVEQLARLYTPLFDEKLTGVDNFLVTNGASAAMYACVQGYVNPGDEVIIFSPFYGVYLQTLELAQGKAVFVPLKEDLSIKGNNANKFSFDVELLKSSVTSKTRAIIVNTPHNPTGKVFTEEELKIISEVAIKNDLLVFSDEPYEFIVYNNEKHIRIANLPGMWERTLTIGSAGKTFSVTGFKIGWVIGSKDLLIPPLLVNQYSAFCLPTPLQRSLALSIETGLKEKYFGTLGVDYEKRKRILLPILQGVFGDENVYEPNGAYFIIVNFKNIDFPQNKDERKDYEFCRFLSKVIGVTAIPLSSFYSEEEAKLGENFCRFAFCKPDETLKEAGVRLEKLKQYFKK